MIPACHKINDPSLSLLRRKVGLFAVTQSDLCSTMRRCTAQLLPLTRLVLKQEVQAWQGLTAAAGAARSVLRRTVASSSALPCCPACHRKLICCAGPMLDPGCCSMWGATTARCRRTR